MHENADRRERGDELGIAREIASLRTRAVSEMTTPIVRGGEEVGAILLRDTVRLGIAAVMAIRERLDAGDLPAAQAVVVALAEQLGEDTLVEAARLWVAAAG